MKTARVVNEGRGERRLVVLSYFMHPRRDGALRAALPDACIVVRDDNGKEAPGLDEEIAALAPLDFEVDGLVLTGWSMGCSGVRTRLSSGSPALAHLRGLVLADGLHASLPPRPEQIDVWAPYVERARRGCFTLILTHTYQTYVETDLPPAQRYTSTVGMARRLTGWELPAPPVGHRVRHTDGRLVVESHGSKLYDGEMHTRAQIQIPELLREHFG